MTVAELGRRMSSAEFAEWMVYAEFEPFGPLADAAPAAWLANINKRKDRHEPILAAEAVSIFAGDAPGPMPADQASMMARDRAWAAARLKAAKPRRRRRAR